MRFTRTFNLIVVRGRSFWDFYDLFPKGWGKKILTITNSQTYVSVVAVQPYEIKTHVNLF